jgi:hypothetical protein
MLLVCLRAVRHATVYDIGRVLSVSRWGARKIGAGPAGARLSAVHSVVRLSQREDRDAHPRVDRPKHSAEAPRESSAECCGAERIDGWSERTPKPPPWRAPPASVPAADDLATTGRLAQPRAGDSAVDARRDRHDNEGSIESIHGWVTNRDDCVGDPLAIR